MDMAPYANGTVSMMGADAKAGVFLVPKARTIIDVGAEEARAVKCDEKGIMVDFVVNERCAAGAGAFIEAMARALEVKLEDMGPLALKAERASPINASCVIFGESDVVSLIHRQESKPEIARAVFDAMADRISSMVHRLGVNPDVVLSRRRRQGRRLCCIAESKTRLNRCDSRIPRLRWRTGCRVNSRNPCKGATEMSRNQVQTKDQNSGVGKNTTA